MRREEKKREGKGWEGIGRKVRSLIYFSANGVKIRQVMESGWWSFYIDLM